MNIGISACTALPRNGSKPFERVTETTACLQLTSVQHLVQLARTMSSSDPHRQTMDMIKDK